MRSVLDRTICASENKVFFTSFDKKAFLCLDCDNSFEISTLKIDLFLKALLFLMNGMPI